MKKQVYIILALILIFNYSYSQQKNLKLSPKEQGELVHFTVVDKVPFRNKCDSFKGKEKTSCYEQSLRNQILEKIDSNEKYDGEMYVWFTVTKKGDLIDVQTKGYPASPVFEEKIVTAVKKLNLGKSTYKGKPVNVRCYTRVLPKNL